MVILHSYIRGTRNDSPSGASGLMVILLSSTSFVFVFLIRPMRMSHPIKNVLIGRFWITSTKITIKCFRIENPGLTQVFCGSTCCFCFTFMSVSLCVLFCFCIQIVPIFKYHFELVYSVCAPKHFYTPIKL